MNDDAMTRDGDARPTDRPTDRPTTRGVYANQGASGWSIAFIHSFDPLLSFISFIQSMGVSGRVVRWVGTCERGCDASMMMLGPPTAVFGIVLTLGIARETVEATCGALRGRGEVGAAAACARATVACAANALFNHAACAMTRPGGPRDAEARRAMERRMKERAQEDAESGESGGNDVEDAREAPAVAAREPSEDSEDEETTEEVEQREREEESERQAVSRRVFGTESNT